MRHGLRVGTALTVLLLTPLLPRVHGPGGLAAQERTAGWSRPDDRVLPAPSLVVFGGALRRTDLMGAGTDLLAGAGVRLPLSGVVRVEPGLRYTRFTAEPDQVDPDADPEVSLLLLDFQLQVQLPHDRVRPWVGVGAGGAMDLRGGDRGDAKLVMSTFSASAGVSLAVLHRLGLLAEGRLRTLDGFGDRAVDLALGLAWEL